MSRETALYIINRYATATSRRSYHGGRQPSTPETQILMFLWFCSNKIGFRILQNLFDLSVSNIHAIFVKVHKFILTELAPEVLRFPEDIDEKEVIAMEFEAVNGFPNVLGCISETYIPTGSPRHRVQAIALQAVCDSKLRFLDIYSNGPNTALEQNVFHESPLSDNIIRLCAPQYHLLGDSAYPLRAFLLTPYRDCGNLSESEKNYNSKFYETLCRIDEAFKLLKSRFHQLVRVEFKEIETMHQFIKCCCVLHNICVNREDFYSEEHNLSEPSKFSKSICKNKIEDIFLTRMGHTKRNEIKNHLLNNQTTYLRM